MEKKCFSCPSAKRYTLVYFSNGICFENRNDFKKHWDKVKEDSLTPDGNERAALGLIVYTKYNEQKYFIGYKYEKIDGKIVCVTAEKHKCNNGHLVLVDFWKLKK